MGFVTVEGRNIHYRFPSQAEARVRQGHKVLMVHGAVDNHLVWRYQHAYLEREHTPLSIDLPGHGDSQGPPIDTPADFRHFIKAFVDVMDLAPFVFAGHSMGGSMALDYAIHHPDDVTGLILVGAGAHWELSAEHLELWTTDPERAQRENVALLFSKKTSQRLVDEYAKQLAAQGPGTCTADFLNCDRYDLLGQINQIQLPTLVVAGDEEEWLENSREIHASAMNTTFEIIPAAGHAVMIEQPALLNEKIGAYLDSLP